MDKFAAFGSYLQHQPSNHLVLSFSDIEKIIGQKLCYSAYRYSAYWVPTKTHILAVLIVESGFSIQEVSLPDQRIILNRVHPR
jgi:hypothetical protein